MKYLITYPSRWKKYVTVHNGNCIYWTEAYGEFVEKTGIPDDAVDCKICGGRKP